MSSNHAAVWLDHREARIFHIGPHDYDEATIESPKPRLMLHRKSGPGADSGQRTPEDQRYYREIADALADAEAILILGPATAKLALLRYLHRDAPKVEERVVGVETVDHPTDRQLVKYVRAYFREHERGIRGGPRPPG